MDCTGIIVGSSPSENVIISNCDKPSLKTSEANESFKHFTGYTPKWVKSFQEDQKSEY